MNKRRLILERSPGLAWTTVHYFKLYDEDFEVSIRFSADKEGFIGAFKRFPKLFTNEILVMVCYYVKSREFLLASEVVGDIEAEIVGRGSSEDIQYVLNLVDDGYEWIDLGLEEQIDIVAKNIRQLLNS